MYIPQADLNNAVLILKYFFPIFCISFLFLQKILCARIEKYLSLKDEIYLEQENKLDKLTNKQTELQDNISRYTKLLKYSEIDARWENYYKKNL